MGDRLTLSPRAYTRVAYAALALLVLIVFSGAGVRLTGSGLGCPDWPSCSGTFLPELSTHVWIEYGNRLLSGVVGIACFAAGVLVFRVRPFRRDLVAPAVTLLVGVVAQGLLGAATVLLHLSWPVVIAHYLLSMALLLAAAVLVWRLRRPVAREGDGTVALATRILVAYGGVVIVAGTFATAAGPHAGGAGTGDVVERLDAFGATTLRTLIHLHGHMATAMGILFVVLWFVARRRGAGRTLMRALTAVCVLMAVQGIVGLVQYHNALPAEVVWVHASLPAVMWTVLVWSWLAAGVPSLSGLRRASARDARSALGLPPPRPAPDRPSPQPETARSARAG
jgi:cytochrome c oxidase assembly protein subunit 15